MLEIFGGRLVNESCGCSFMLAASKGHVNAPCVRGARPPPKIADRVPFFLPPFPPPRSLPWVKSLTSGGPTKFNEPQDAEFLLHSQGSAVSFNVVLSERFGITERCPMEWYEAGWHYYEQTRPADDRLSSLPTEWQRELA